MLQHDPTCDAATHVIHELGRLGLYTELHTFLAAAQQWLESQGRPLHVALNDAAACWDFLPQALAQASGICCRALGIHCAQHHHTVPAAASIVRNCSTLSRGLHHTELLVRALPRPLVSRPGQQSHGASAAVNLSWLLWTQLVTVEPCSAWYMLSAHFKEDSSSAHLLA